MPRTYDIVAGNINGDNCTDIVITGYSKRLKSCDYM